MEESILSLPLIQDCTFRGGPLAVNAGILPVVRNPNSTLQELAGMLYLTMQLLSEACFMYSYHTVSLCGTPRFQLGNSF